MDVTHSSRDHCDSLDPPKTQKSQYYVPAIKSWKRNFIIRYIGSHLLSYSESWLFLWELQYELELLVVLKCQCDIRSIISLL